MKQIIFLLSFCAIGVNAQEINVGTGASLTIGAGASLNAFGLELAPTVDYTINENSITVEYVQVIVPDGNSVERVYSMTEDMAAFEGVMTFNYLDTEIPGGAGTGESTLELQLKDSFDVWSIVDGSTVDEATNKVTRDFGAGSSDLFNGVTAASDQIALPIDKFDLDGIVIYPNPVTIELRITSDKDLKIQIYNSLGQKMKESSSKIIDMSKFSNGIYVMKVIDVASDASNNYKIIKE